MHAVARCFETVLIFATPASALSSRTLAKEISSDRSRSGWGAGKTWRPSLTKRKASVFVLAGELPAQATPNRVPEKKRAREPVLSQTWNEDAE
jgi:hypothetical protein